MMNQYIFYCDSVAPQTITLSFTNTKTGSLVTPPGWTSGAPRPSNPPPAPPDSASATASHPQVSAPSNTTRPSAVATGKTLSSGVIAAISLAAVAIVAVTSATIFWFCIRPWLKNRGLQTTLPLPRVSVHENDNYPWGPDSLAPKPLDRRSIPYPSAHSELPAHLPRLLGDEKKQSDIGSDDMETGIEPVEDGYNRGSSRGEISPLPSPDPHSIGSGTPSGIIDRSGAISPVSIAATDGSGRRQRFGFLTPENAMTGYVEEDDDDEEEEGIRTELEGSPSFHTLGSIRRKRDSMPKELDSKRNSTPKELDSNRNPTLKELDSKRESILEEQPPTPGEEKAPKEEPSKEEALKEDTSKEETPEVAAKEEASKEEASKEEAPKEEAPKEETSGEETPKEASKETSKEETPKEAPKQTPEDIPEEPPKAE
ncbi:hypothetical protein GP486_006951 [Trichoglossum hirsutum]|uniref:Uncharacterized protein n=1 Tax=Trichoglossum hirsutum TaxID=265104 RepID=A0A9P8L7Q0_9PEZI|nr:hypothetical protein GP486_006951 [Trichoglossum hirsutum]